MNTQYPTDYNVPVVEKATAELQKMLKNYTTADAQAENMTQWQLTSLT